MADGTNLSREVEAAAILKESIAAACADDADLLIDMIEGETGVFEIVDALLLADIADDGMLDGIAGAIKALQERKERFDHRIKTRRALIERALLILDLKKVERPTATISLANRAPKTEVDDEAAIPSEFFDTKPVLAKKRLDEALKAGREVPGAHLSNGSQSLTVRRK